MIEDIYSVMFDLGGTLIDLEPPRDVVFHRVLMRHGYGGGLDSVTRAIAEAERRLDDEFANLDGTHEDKFWIKYDKFILERAGYKTDFSQFAMDVSKEFESIVPEVTNWVAYEDSRPLLDVLKKRDLKLGVISNATDLARRVMDNLDLTKYFDVIVISAEVGVRKPDKRIFQLAAKKAKVAPSKTLYVGDKFAVDILGAKNAGMNAILIDRAGIYSDVDCPRIRSLDELDKRI